MFSEVGKTRGTLMDKNAVEVVPVPELVCPGFLLVRLVWVKGKKY